MFDGRIFEGVIVTCYVDALSNVGNSSTNFGKIFVIIVQYKTAGEMKFYAMSPLSKARLY